MERFSSSCVLLKILLLGLLLVGCNAEVDQNLEGETSEESVTIKIAYLFDGDLWENRVRVLEDDLPNIKFERLPYGNTSESLQELFATGERPDIVIGPIEPVRELGIIEPLEDLIERHNFDINSLNPALMRNVRALTKEGNIVGFPDNRPFFALYYNKDVFDTFGIPYPDHDKPMTWQETIELAGQMTGVMNDVEYVGLTHGPFNGFGPGDWPLNELATNMTDPETGEVNLLDNPKLRKYFDLMVEYYKIPGAHDPNREGDWFGQGKAAMFIAQENYLDSIEDPTILEAIDLVPVPIWEEEPDAGPYRGFRTLIITNFSEHKDEAIKVLEAYVSKKHQLRVSESGLMGSVLTDPEINERYAINSPGYKGKNREAFFAHEPAMYQETISPWDQYVDIWKAIDQIATTDKDIVTILRELEEESEARIKEAMEIGE